MPKEQPSSISSGRAGGMPEEGATSAGAAWTPRTHKNTQEHTDTGTVHTGTWIGGDMSRTTDTAIVASEVGGLQDLAAAVS